MTKKIRTISTACALCSTILIFFAIPALSQTTDTNSNRSSSGGNELLLLDNPIVITAAQTKTRVSDSPAATSVITEEDIRKSGATTVPELLRSIPGVDVVEANRGFDAVGIRGFNSLFAGDLLIMVNGKSIYQDIFGGTLWVQEPILISQIKQIEVVRGPGSVLYGANAFSGVINIITKTPEEMKANGGGIQYLAAHGTEDSTVAEGAYNGGNDKGFVYTVAAGYHGTDGIGGLQDSHIHDSYSVPIGTFDATQKVHCGSFNFDTAFSGGKTDITNPYIEMEDASNRVTHVDRL